MLAIFFGFYFVFLIGFWIWRKLDKYRHFEKLGIKGPKPSFLFGNLLQLYKTEKKIADDVIEEWFEKYGPVVGYYIGERPMLLVRDVQMLNDIFVKNAKCFYNRVEPAVNAKPFIYSLIFVKDKNYRRVRKLLSPLFKPKSPSLVYFKTVFEDCAKRFCLHISHSHNHAEFVIDVYDKVQCFTLDVISRSLLNIETNVYDKDDYIMNAVREFFKMTENEAVYLAFSFPFFSLLFTFINNYLTAGKMTKILIRHLKDKLSFFLHNYKKNDLSLEKNLITSMLYLYQDKKISQNELIGNMLLMLLAGYETTSNALTYTLYLLAQHQDVQEKVYQELQQSDTHLNYLKAVWYESLRYYPPVSLFVNRKASYSCVINGLRIEKGTTVQAPIWSIHHCAEYWPKPWSFNPERFASDNKHNLRLDAFLPFGLGLKTCLGMNFATEEAKVFLAYLIGNYKITFCEQTLESIEFSCKNVIRNPAKPIYLRFELRN